MNTYTVEYNGITLEQMPLDKLTVQLQMQGLTVSLPHEHQLLLKQCNVSCGFSVGTKIPTKNHSYIKILAIVDGYVMARYKGCIPFCKSIKDMQLMIEENRSQRSAALRSCWHLLTKDENLFLWR